MESTRLPGKPLKKIGDKTLIQRVFEQASKSDAERVLVATDSEEVVSHCFEHNIETVLTKSDHQTGSDRLAEAVEILNLEDTQVIINVQGDEPFVNPTDINNLYRLTVNKNSNMTTLFTDLNFEDINNLEENSIDFYASVKSLYLQDRRKRILNATGATQTQDDSDWEEIE